jgi:hypothetical protein
MACYPGPFFGHGPYGPPGPFGPCGVCVGPCACGPCPPLISGVGKCFPPPPLGQGAWEIDILPITGTNATGWQPIYTSNLRAATAITSIVDGAAPIVTYNLQNVKGGVCSINASLTVTKIVGTALITQTAVGTTTVSPYTTTATLTFNTAPGGGAITVGPILNSQSTLSTKFT